MSNAPNNDSSSKPSFVQALETVFGAPSQQAFGSSVFYIADDQANIEKEAMSRYRYFLGSTWEKLGESNWLSTWELAYERKLGSPPDIVMELKGIPDRNVRMSASLLIENHEDATAAAAALGGAFDQPAVRELKVFKIGDGAAMSGLLIAAIIQGVGCLCLILLLD